MAALKFVDSHNMVAYLERPTDIECDSLERLPLLLSSLEAEQVSGNITKTRSKATLNEPTPQRTGSGSGPRRQDTMGDTITQTRVQDLETTKTAQAKEITSLNKRVKKLEQRGSLGDQEDTSKQGRNIAEIDADVDISLDMADQEVNVAEKEVSAADPVTTASEVVTTASVDISTTSVPITISTATPTTPPTTTTKDDMTLAETLMEIKSAKPKAIGVVMQEPNEISRISVTQQQIQEKAQGSRDKEEEDRLARQREEEDNIVSWDNAQAMMEADYQMAERLQAEEQASLTDEEKARLFVQLLDARKKHFAALRAQEIRNKPPTKMQKRTTMCNYLKNMAGYKHNQLRHKSFDDTQKLFDKALKRVNTFVPMDTEKVEESTKKQKVEDETEQVELKECFEIISFDEDAVNTIPLATKQPPIVDYKITRDERKIYYHITRADESNQVYMRFKDMLKMFDREDLEILYRIVKDRFKSTKPVGDNRVLWGYLMTMFEPSTCNEMWREQGRYLIKSWNLIDLCGVHCLILESMYIYMLIEKEYPLAQFTFRRMWEGKLQVDYECKMAFELLRKAIVGRQSSEVYTELFQKAHLYVIQNTDEIVSYIERHRQVLKTENLGKRIAFLENEHIKSFAKWLHKEVERELAISKESVSETVRWISYGPCTTVVKYDVYNINGYTFRTKCHDGKVYQNSEIWVLDYHFRQIPLFKCDWVNHRVGGVKRDTLGYTLVDLNNLGHKVDPFILASQARQVFYVKDQIDKKLSIVFKTPPNNYKDTYDEVDEEFSTVIHQCNVNILPCVNQRDLDSKLRQQQPHSTHIALLTVGSEGGVGRGGGGSEEIDYDSPEPPKSLLKWYHYLSDEYKDNAQASEASSKAKVEACGSKVKVEACGSKAMLQASTKTLTVKSLVLKDKLVYLVVQMQKTWDAIKAEPLDEIPPNNDFC
ncbi:putative ribonuclease H-like domain-containing protein [Tanacetum coccineum]